MSAFVISDVVGLDPELVARYRARLRARQLSSTGGQYLTQVRSAIDQVEGDCSPANIVLLRFSSMARAREWYR